MRRLPYYIVCLWAVCVLMGCEDGQQCRRQLEELEQRNRAGEQLLNDSLAEALVDYFDRHGDANERMRSRYMLGRTYYHLGELPRALETYLEAASCADTNSDNCAYKVLSRIHAQSAVIYDLQVQPRSQLEELRCAVYYAWKGKDSIQAIECLAQQSGAYSLLHDYDSAIYVREQASRMYDQIGKKTYSSLTLSPIIRLLINKHQIEKARNYLHLYETHSGVFNERGDIDEGREIYYNIKGDYYLAVNQLDSAEYMFRKELRVGKDLNNQIAGCKGLQKVYELKGISDSIAKYADLGYTLNDSAYSLSEMANIQKFRASYNYNHQKVLAEQNELRAEKSRMWLIVIILLFVALVVLACILFQKYKADREKEHAEYCLNQLRLEETQSELLELREKSLNSAVLIDKKTEEIKALQTKISDYQKRQNSFDAATLEDRIDNATIVIDLNSLLNQNPVQSATQSQMRELKQFVNEQIPYFYESLNALQVLRPIEYEVCVLTRCHFKPASICKLLNRSDGYIANIRKGILLKVYGIKGSPKDLDERIMRIN